MTGGRYFCLSCFHFFTNSKSVLIVSYGVSLHKNPMDLGRFLELHPSVSHHTLVSFYMTSVEVIRNRYLIWEDFGVKWLVKRMGVYLNATCHNLDPNRHHTPVSPIITIILNILMIINLSPLMSSSSKSPLPEMAYVRVGVLYPHNCLMFFVGGLPNFQS